MKKVLLFSLIFTTVISATAQKTIAKPAAKTPPSAGMKSLIDSFSYAAGLNVARNMKEQGINELNTALMSKAIDDVFKNKKVSLTDEAANGCLQRQLEVFAKTKAVAEKAKGVAFLEANKKNKGVVVLPDGLQYMIIKQGDSIANKPKVTDTVVVNYIGATIDGKEFDNSFKRGQPAVFPLGVVIRGWQEILQLMPVGSHWKVFIPSELGYGEAGYGNGAIAPNAALVFDITLEGIKPGSPAAPLKAE